MKCSNCGEEIKDGSMYCEHCGADIVDTFVLDVGSLDKVKDYEKEQKQKEKELKKEQLKKLEEERRAEAVKRKEKQMPFYENQKSYRICTVTAFLAAVLMIILPLLHWSYLWVKMDETIFSGFSLLDLCKEKNITAIVLTVCFVLTGLFMLYFAVHDNVQRIKLPEIRLSEPYMLILRILPVLFVILLMIIFTHTKVYRFQYDNNLALQMSFQSQIDISKYFNHNVRGMFSRMGHGAAFWSSFLSILLYIFSQGFKFVLNTLNEEADEE